MKKKYRLAFDNGDKVKYSLGDEDRIGFITGISIRPAGITYAVTWACNRSESWHNDFELILLENQKNKISFAAVKPKANIEEVKIG